jgi:hypothetical protein
MAEITPKDLIDTCLAAIKPYKGDLTKLESAIGALIVGKRLGWRVMFLVHNRATIREYEKMLGVKFQLALPEVGELAHKSIGWMAVQKVGNFWKAVKGEISGIRSTLAVKGPQ